MANLRSKQIASIESMVSGRQQGLDGVDPLPSWKVLIYDKIARDIVSPILSLAQMRDFGISFHDFLLKEREPIPDAPAVYFVLPTEENIARICEDIRRHLYDTYEFNFLNEIPHGLLERIAKSSVEANCAQSITKVCDVYNNFISLEEDLFIVRNQNIDAISFQAINNRTTPGEESEALKKDIIDSLFSIFASQSIVPIIRASPKDAAAVIAQELNQRFQDHLKNSRNTLFASGAPGQQRPVLILLDRIIDPSIIFHHTWTYQALVHDLLNFQLNRVTTKETNSSGVIVDKSYDLDKSDGFWRVNRGRPFPTVAGAVEEDLQIYKAKEQEIRQLRGAQDSEEIEAEAAIADNTAKLTSAISSLPELLAQKRFLDLHTNLLTLVMDQIKQRQLDSFYEIEDELLSKKPPSRAVIELLQSQQPTLEDKLRLVAIYLLSTDDINVDELARFEAILAEAGADLSSIAYLKKHKRDQQPTQVTPKSLFSHATKMLKTGHSLWNQGVKALLPTSNDLPITRIVDALMEIKPSELTKEFLYLDPKVVKGNSTGEVPKGRQPFEQAFVFMVGGGNYVEYQNLIEYAERSGGKKQITYGTTELMTATSFLQQLTQLTKDGN